MSLIQFQRDKRCYSKEVLDCSLTKIMQDKHDILQLHFKHLAYVGILWSLKNLERSSSQAQSSTVCTSSLLTQFLHLFQFKSYGHGISKVLGSPILQRHTMSTTGSLSGNPAFLHIVWPQQHSGISVKFPCFLILLFSFLQKQNHVNDTFCFQPELFSSLHGPQLQ